MQLSFDFTDLLRFADDLDAAVDRVTTGTRGAVTKSAAAVKATMQADMGESAHFKQVASSISYDLTGNGTTSSAEIGPVKGSPGSLANIAYFGGANGGGGTVRDPQEALDEEADPLEEALGKLLELDL